MSFFGRLFGRLETNQISTQTAPSTVAIDTRHARDRQTAQTALPRNTREEAIGDTTYWVYSFTDQFERQYTMGAYFDGREYQVRVLSPRIPEEVGLTPDQLSIHDCHIFPNGRICLNPPANGALTLQEAYSKSVIWATGFTAYCEIGQFPFSKNNER
ncbi:hypothetical protein [Arthrobacter oryzae]|uniref:hypothetical protein n=1 Tax=Arthrobacter oryzae TaxID=409290 RepID=UPI00273A95B9|nr:hypothetical protein [Arthrobacter oryzae]WLQ05796.1 hypothetical protein Q8Z05_17035 [Arthrobacter oryzae]